MKTIVDPHIGHPGLYILVSPLKNHIGRALVFCERVYCISSALWDIRYGRFMTFWLNYIDLNFQAILLMLQYDYYLPPMFLYELKDKGIHPARNRAPGNNNIPPHLRCVHSGPLKHSWCHLDSERTIPFAFYRVRKTASPLASVLHHSSTAKHVLIFRC